jgi:hypothetical protein
MQADQAKLRAAESAQSGLEATMRQQFGDALTSAAMAPASSLFQRLLTGRTSVLRVTLPGDYTGAAPAQITVDTPDGQQVAAQMLSSNCSCSTRSSGFRCAFAALYTRLPCCWPATVSIRSRARSSMSFRSSHRR